VESEIIIDTIKSTTNKIEQIEPEIQCRDSCFTELVGELCSVVVATTTTAYRAPSENTFLTPIDTYIRSLPELKLAKIISKMSETSVEEFVNDDDLIIWIRAYLQIFVTVLYTCCVVMLALFGTNRLIIHWNHVNDHPHGDVLYYLMVAVAAKKQRVRNKLKVLAVLDHLRDHANMKGSKISLLKSISMGAQRVGAIFRPRTKGVQPTNEYDQSYYPEIVMLDVRRDSPMTKMGAKLGTSYDDKGSFVVVDDVSDGPLFRAGLMQGDVLLTVNNRRVESMDQLNSVVEDETDMEFVVRRMSQAQGRRGDKVYTCNITKSNELGLGLGLKRLRAGVGANASNTFLYVNELREYANGDAGPGLIAGVHQYDLILKINGMAIHTMSDAKQATQDTQIAEVQVRRMIRQARSQEAATTQVTVVVTRGPGDSLGLSLSETYGAESAEPFLLVTKVRGGSVGERAGIMVNDIFAQVNGQSVHDLDELKQLIHGLEKFELTVHRQS